MTTTKITWEAIANVHDMFARQAVGIFNNVAEVQPQLFLIGLRPSGQIERVAAIAPPMLETFFSSPAAKDAFSGFLAGVFTEGSPVQKSIVDATGFTPQVAVQINEAWVSTQEGGSREEACRTSPEEDPNRQEAVMVVIHMSTGSVPTIHPIYSHPSRHAIFREFVVPDAETTIKGRFALQESFSERPRH